MKVQVRREVLRDAMNLIDMVVPRRSPKPILNCVRLEANDGHLLLRGTNLESTVTYDLTEVLVDEPGEVVVRCELLKELAKVGRSEVFVLRSTEGGCEVVEEDAKYELYASDPKKYPAEPEAQGEADAIMPLDELRNGIKRTSFAAAKQTSRYAIGGVFLKQGNGRAVLVATDGRRLALCQVEEKDAMETKGIVPPKAMNVLASIGADAEEPVEVTVRERQAWFTCGPVKLVTALLDGKFPEYSRIIPRDCPVKVTMNTKAAAAAIRQARLTGDAMIEGVKLVMEKGRATFAAFGNKAVKAHASIPIEYDGEKAMVGFNPDYVLEGLRAVKADTFELEMEDASKPCLIRGAGDFLYVFMPVMLS